MFWCFHIQNPILSRTCHRKPLIRWCMVWWLQSLPKSHEWPCFSENASTIDYWPHCWACWRSPSSHREQDIPSPVPLKTTTVRTFQREMPASMVTNITSWMPTQNVQLELHSMRPHVSPLAMPTFSFHGNVSKRCSQIDSRKPAGKGHPAAWQAATHLCLPGTFEWEESDNTSASAKLEPKVCQCQTGWC